MLTLHTLPWNDARAEAEPIRFKVFVEEQKVPAEIELDEHDPACVHVIAREGERAVGTGRLLPDAHIGRMAVLREARNRGVGSAMLKTLMEVARSRGDREVVLSAQTQAIDFYVRHGFAKEGSVYMDAGIPHQDMRRRF